MYEKHKLLIFQSLYTLCKVSFVDYMFKDWVIIESD